MSVCCYPPQTTSTTTQLLHLNFWHQRVEAQEIETQLQSCAYVKALNIDLSRTQMNDEALIKISAGLIGLTQLSKIFVDLSFNALSESGLKQFAENLSRCKSLSSIVINLESNCLRECSVLAFVSNLNCDQLNRINISFRNNRVPMNSLSKITQKISILCPRLVLCRITI